jgi:hypothetical protein
MVREAFDVGFSTALARYGIKEAGTADTLSRWAGTAARTLVGHPEKLLDAKSFRPGGMFNVRNVLWPTEPGRPLATWLGRTFGTLLPAYGVYQAMKGDAGDPSRGRLANTLGAAGNALGWAYGMPALGLLGAPMLGRLGQSLGEGVGQLIGGSPRPARIAPPVPPEMRQQGGPTDVEARV